MSAWNERRCGRRCGRWYWGCDEFIQGSFLDAYEDMCWFEGGVYLGASLKEVIDREDSPVTRLYEDVDTVFVDKLLDGVRGEWASAFPDSGWVLAPDANDDFGRR